MKFVPRGQMFTGEEPHPLDPRQEPPQGCGPVSAIGVIVECFDDQAHTLGLTQHRRKGDGRISRMPLRDQPGCRKGFTISSGQRTARPGRSSE
jgi:hypothetical protein